MTRYPKLLLSILTANMFSLNKPIIVCLNVTNRCNMNCSYCYGDYYNRKTCDFTTDQLLELIDTLSMMGTRLIHLGGGEPLIRDDISKIISHIKEKNILCFMNTNGLLIPDKIDAIKKLDSLTISIDGPEDINDINRGKGTFRRIIKSIKLAQDHGISVNTNTVINRHNISRIDEVLALLDQLKVSAEFNLPYEQELGNKNNEVMNISDEQIKNVLKKIITYKNKGGLTSFSTNTRSYTLNWPFSYKKKIAYNNDLPKGFKPINCQMGRLMCLIDSDGLVYPCGQLIGQFPALNMLEVGLKKAWDNLYQNKRCTTCYSVCFNEFNQLFNLNPKVLYLSALRIIKRITKK